MFDRDGLLYPARDREEYWFGIGCVEGKVREEQQKRIDKGETL